MLVMIYLLSDSHSIKDIMNKELGKLQINEFLSNTKSKGSIIFMDLLVVESQL